MPLILYSVNTYLAYIINERYYGRVHYVWCSEVFDAMSRNSLGRYGNIPPSSNPRDIYLNLYEEVKRGDRHSAKIDQSREEILHKAEEKFKTGEISQSQYDEIGKIVDSVGFSEFRPLLYIIPYHNVAGIVREATVEERAHPLSLEFIIESLDRGYFDPIEIL